MSQINFEKLRQLRVRLGEHNPATSALKADVRDVVDAILEAAPPPDVLADIFQPSPEVRKLAAENDRLRAELERLKANQAQPLPAEFVAAQARMREAKLAYSHDHSGAIRELDAASIILAEEALKLTAAPQQIVGTFDPVLDAEYDFVLPGTNIHTDDPAMAINAWREFAEKLRAQQPACAEIDVDGLVQPGEPEGLFATVVIGGNRLVSSAPESTMLIVNRLRAAVRAALKPCAHAAEVARLQKSLENAVAQAEADVEAANEEQKRLRAELKADVVEAALRTTIGAVESARDFYADKCARQEKQLERLREELDRLRASNA